MPNRINKTTLRPTSIKTRIETIPVSSVMTLTLSLRPTSIKTRIETGYEDDYSPVYGRLSDQLPLKQGLKHVFSPNNKSG